MRTSMEVVAINEDIEDSNNDNVEGRGSDEQDSESDTCSDNQEKHINDEPNIFISKTKGSSAHPEEGDAVVKVMELVDDERNYTTEETCTGSGNEDLSTDENTCTCSGDDICYEDDGEYSIVSVGNKVAVQTTEILNSDNESYMETSDQHANTMDSLTFLQIAQSPEVLNEYQDGSEICRIQTGLGFKICGGNIDKMVNSRYMRLDRQNRSLHYFHSFAVQNRVNFSGLEDVCSSSIPHAEEIAKSIVPSLADDQKLKQIAILISRVLVKHLKFFRLAFDDLIQWHIKHPFYKEMSAKSTVVSLCLLCLSKYLFLS